jgi:hypothetical protein
VPFARRFTPIEQKLHRDAVYQLVAEGKLPSLAESPQSSHATTAPVEICDAPRLTSDAINLLIKLATAESSHILQPSAFNSMSTVHDRAEATHRAAFNQLVNQGLLEHSSGSAYVLTLDGYTAADAYLTLIDTKRS